ncbi:MAG: padAc [Nocardioides sp.]|jgi:ferredoxin|uniref:ferredoxin n=1 Tax=Nocardioides sp. TaxID=35761 RepID=UPI002626C5C5|nr:ferredoxin [Nocardioides sp.]MCW2835022.1 padAc [Nocardioides sp.]
MKLGSDVGKCQGYGNCVAIDEQHFDLDDDGMVVVVQQEVSEGERETTEEAVRSCPVAAIWIEGAR